VRFAGEDHRRAAVPFENELVEVARLPGVAPPHPEVADDESVGARSCRSVLSVE
jgi:hypothetical protein